MSESLSGGCLCGAVRYTAQVAKRQMDVCHCRMCRRWTGGVFMAVPCAGLSVDEDAALGTFRSSEWAERAFCRECGTSLFWRLTEGGDHIAVSLPSLDDPSGFAFVEEIFVDEQPELYAFAGNRVRKTGSEVMAEFAANRES